MAQAKLSELRGSILDIVRRSALARFLKDVTVAADRYDDTAGFLDIAIELDPLDKIPDEALLELIAAIEDGLIPIDERFPSVRFPAEATV